jgi:hypothetical protein
LGGCGDGWIGRHGDAGSRHPCCHHHDHHHGHQDHGHHHHDHHHDHHHEAEVSNTGVYPYSPMVPKDWRPEDLKKWIESLKVPVLRTKEVVGQKEFDLVQRSWNWGKYREAANYFNLITERQIEDEDFAQMKKSDIVELDQDIEQEEIGDLYFKQNTMNEKDLIEFSDREIEKLVEQYNLYMAWEQEIKDLKNQVAETLGVAQKTEILMQINQLQLRQKELGEAMKFANPYIWMGYKMKAYLGSEKEIKTIGDLRVHAASPTYICHKRINYLAEGMKKNGYGDLWSEDDLPVETTLAEILEHEAFQALLRDEKWLAKWVEYEYFEQDGRVAKWENFLAEKNNAHESR